MTKASILVALAALCLTHNVQAERVRIKTKQKDEATLSCKDICVQCRDGSSVYYGRSRNWWKVGAMATLGAAGIKAASMGDGVVTVAAAGGGGMVLSGMVLKKMVGKKHQEPHADLSGSPPSSGLFCDRVDVLRFDKANKCMATALMERSPRRVGRVRVRSNFLQPYDADGKLVNRTDLTQADIINYDAGCKTIATSGIKGAMGNLAARFRDKCSSKAEQGALTCSQHSKLCGPDGVAGITHATSSDVCMQECKGPSMAQVKCSATFDS